ncbi:AI-2E family transporter [Congregibacter sp.]|uniref:AI-2E family transporter n=1 Tax=Congregibacter sp. TaxID=2744308 RepID=UPI00385C9EA0
MTIDTDAARKFLSRDFMDFCIRLGLTFVVIVACVRVFAPFMPIMIWGIILSISLYPMFMYLCRRLGWGSGKVATLIVVLGILLLGVPTVMLGSSFATHIFDVIGNFDAQTVTIELPDPSVKEWPIVGERVYAAWSAAHTDLPGYIESLQPQLGNFSKSALQAAASTAGTLFFFFGALIIAGIMMAYGESGTAAMARIFSRMVGEQRGPGLHTITTLTVRSVATGVVGVAFIQALLLGVGFMLAGIPAAGLLALVVLVIGILQLPALIVSIPAIAYVWGMGDGGTIVNVALTVYFIVAGFADNVLKPMLLGRGVSVPMPVVLIGALGGMMGAGIVGLFVGAVILSVGYELFMDWVDETAPAPDASEDSGDTADVSG